MLQGTLCGCASCFSPVSENIPHTFWLALYSPMSGYVNLSGRLNFYALYIAKFLQLVSIIFGIILVCILQGLSKISDFLC
jgi:hypothetical protein